MSILAEARSAGEVPAQRHFIYKTGLCEGTRVTTQDGNLPVEYLCKGDMIVTTAGPRVLRGITAKPLTDCPILVLRSALGPGRPSQDMYLAPEQAVHLSDWRGKRLVGSDQPSIPLSRLVDNDMIQWAEHPGELLVYDLEFLTQQVFYAEGVEVMSTASPLRVVEGMAAA